jgi:hypothetical protein
MSAYLVDSNDFAVIAQYAGEAKRCPYFYNLDSKSEIEVENVPALAVLLAQENIKSLEHRYPGQPAGGFLSQGQTVTDFLLKCRRSLDGCKVTWTLHMSSAYCSATTTSRASTQTITSLTLTTSSGSSKTSSLMRLYRPMKKDKGRQREGRSGARSIRGPRSGRHCRPRGCPAR